MKLSDERSGKRKVITMKKAWTTVFEDLHGCVVEIMIMTCQ